VIFSLLVCLVGLFFVALGLGLITEEISVFALIFGGALFLLGAFMFYGAKAAKNAESFIKRLPVLTANVKIISKVSEQVVDGWGGTVSTKNSYFVVFEFSDGNRKKLSVNMSQYALLAENDSGVLEYKDINSNLEFINFKRQT